MTDATLISSPIEEPARRLAYPLKTFAKAIGCDLSTLYREARRGRLTIRKLGRSSIVLAEEGEEYLRSLPKGPDSDLSNEATEAREGGR